MAELKDMYAIVNLDDEHKGIDFSEANWHLIILVKSNVFVNVWFAFIVGGSKLTPFTRIP